MTLIAHGMLASMWPRLISRGRRHVACGSEAGEVRFNVAADD